jgi:hypothetical protein
MCVGTTFLRYSKTTEIASGWKTESEGQRPLKVYELEHVLWKVLPHHDRLR